MSITLYELCGEDSELRFSPFVWRTRFALHHKQLAFDSVPLQFINKQPIAETGQGKVPVINDNGVWVHDSFAIACHLDQAYAKHRLMPDGGQPLMHGFNQFVDNFILPLIRPIVILPVYDNLDAESKAYFKETREAMLGMTFEAYAGNKDEKIEQLRQKCALFDPILTSNKFFGGDAPNYGDYILMGGFMWAHCLIADPLLNKDSPLYDWQERMLDLFGGMARNAKRATA